MESESPSKGTIELLEWVGRMQLEALREEYNTLGPIYREAMADYGPKWPPPPKQLRLFP